jgi:hypothetical protein
MAPFEKKAGLSQKLTSGRRKTHGGFSFLATGRLPEHRREVERYLTAARLGLIKNLGPVEADLTAAQAILIDRVIGKLGVLRCMEEHVREKGVMEGDQLAPALRASYLSYSNSLRLDLQALGIDRHAVEPELTITEVIREFDEEKERKAKAEKKGR